jgi:hypothetical protein
MSDFGSLQTVLVCKATTAPDAVQGACPAGFAPVTVDAYLVAPSQAFRLDVATQPFDAATAGEYFGFAFASTVALWALAYGAGQVIKLIRNS